MGGEYRHLDIKIEKHVSVAGIGASHGVGEADQRHAGQGTFVHLRLHHLAVESHQGGAEAAATYSCAGTGWCGE